MQIERADGSIIAHSAGLLGRGSESEVHAIQIDGVKMAVKVFMSFANNSTLIRDAIHRSVLAGVAVSRMSQDVLRLAPGIEPILARNNKLTIPGILLPRANGMAIGVWLEQQPVNKAKLSLLSNLLVGLSELHIDGFAHNDLSFGNILVADRLWLIDFDRSGDKPMKLKTDSVFYTRNGFGVRHDLRAFAILATMMMTGRHPFTKDLQSLIKGEASFNNHVISPASLGWAKFLRPALELEPGLLAQDLLQVWPDNDH